MAAVVDHHLTKRSPLRVAALVRTKVDRRRIVYQRMNDGLADLGLPIAKTEIPLAAAFQTAAAERATVLTWREDRVGADAYRHLALELGVPGRPGVGQAAARKVWL